MAKKKISEMDWLEEQDACDKGIRLVQKHGTIRDAWQCCTDPELMFWLLELCIGDNERLNRPRKLPEGFSDYGLMVAFHVEWIVRNKSKVSAFLREAYNYDDVMLALSMVYPYVDWQMHRNWDA